MRALVIDEETKKQAAQVRTWARAHVYYPDLGGTVPGDDPRFVLHIANGYRCVFSYTATPRGLYRHLSVSVHDPIAEMLTEGRGKYPSPEAMGMIAGLFEFTGTGNDVELIARIRRNEFPRAWLFDMDEEAHCIVLAEELKDEPVPHH